MNDRLIVIGLNGVARSGKDTTSKILESRFGFFRLAQGDAIRATLFNLMMPSWEILKEVEAAGLTHIDALQTLGGECKDDIERPEVWTDVTLAAISYIARFHPKPRRRIVIPGMRYGCEGVRFRQQIEDKWGGIYRTWKLVRPGAGLAGIRGQHQSERESEKVVCDLTIADGGTIAELEMAVSLYANQLIEGRTL